MPGPGCPVPLRISAATYGGGQAFREPACENPLNVYGYSKFLFDQVVRQRLAAGVASWVVGFRYFNVYGPRENHKGKDGLVAFHHFNEFRREGRVKLFEGSHGYGNGEQKRDFVFVGDVAKVNMFFLDHPERKGIFNVGSGRAQSFNDVALSTVNSCRRLAGNALLSLDEILKQGLLEYVPFPDALKESIRPHRGRSHPLAPGRVYGGHGYRGRRR